MLGNYRYLFLLASAGACLAQTPNLPALYSTSGALRSQSIKLGKLSAGTGYTFLFSIDSPAALGPNARVGVSVVEGEHVLLAKTLHAGDIDLYGTINPRAVAELRVSAEGAPAVSYHLQINRAPFAAPGHAWQDAAPMTLGQLVVASNDELEYFPLPGASRKEIVNSPGADHWYRFDFDAPHPKLVFFQLELTDRDDLPVDVALFRGVGR